MVIFLPLFDAYPRLARKEHMDDPRLSPILLDVRQVPKDVLMVVAGIDILVHEQQEFLERVREEIKGMGEEGAAWSIEELYIEEAFHGWMERTLPRTGEWAWGEQLCADWTAVPKSIMEPQRQRVYKRSIEFLKDVHRKYGFDVEQI